MIVGLTGGIGSGKSIAGKMFEKFDIDVVDADNIVKNVLDKNNEVKKGIANMFGDNFIDSNNEVDRKLLREYIFKNPNKKKELESIIHPIVKNETAKFINQSKSDYVLLIVPLIFETQSSKSYEKIIVIDCDEETQILRASARDKQSVESIQNIIKSQASRKERLSIADYVILNNSTIDNLGDQVKKVHKKIIKLLP